MRASSKDASRDRRTRREPGECARGLADASGSREIPHDAGKWAAVLMVVCKSDTTTLAKELNENILFLALQVCCGRPREIKSPKRNSFGLNYLFES
jgi:hypothetical protein